MPKVSKKTKAVAVKQLLVRTYHINNPFTLRERENKENVNRYLKGLGNWPDSRGFCTWGSRNKKLREKKRSKVGTERTPSGMTLRQQQFLEDIKGYEEGRDGPAV
jgi:hypothetical protein